MAEQQAVTGTIGGHLSEAGQNLSHAARETARRGAEHARNGYGAVRDGLTHASSAISNKGLVTATREGAHAFWKARPVATVGLAVGGTILAAHVVGHAFAGNRQQNAATRDRSGGGPNV